MNDVLLITCNDYTVKFYRFKNYGKQPVYELMN